jgi:hypothetical protein
VPFGESPLEFVRLAHDWRLVVVVLFVLGFFAFLLVIVVGAPWGLVGGDRRLAR